MAIQNLKKFILANFTILLLTGCNYSITMIHTEGQASDVVDETDTLTPSTSLTIPVSAV